MTQVEDPDSVQEIVQFREAVKQKNLSTTQEIGSVSKIVQSIAARHFPRTTQTTPTITRWQQPGIKQGIAGMWKAWRRCRRSSRDITLQGLSGRWRPLYKQHKNRCRTTTKTYLLERMQEAEQAAQQYNQRPFWIPRLLLYISNTRLYAKLSHRDTRQVQYGGCVQTR